MTAPHAADSVIRAKLVRGLLAAGADRAAADLITDTAIEAAAQAILAASKLCRLLATPDSVTAFGIAMQLLEGLAAENADRAEAYMVQRYNTSAHTVTLDARQ